MRKLKFIRLLFLFGFVAGMAQEKVPISLDEVKQKVEANNQKLQVNEYEYIEMKAQFNETRATFLPQLKVSHTGSRTNNPVMAFGARLNQGIFTENDFAVNNLNNPDGITNFVTSFQIEQPIINMDKIMMRSALKYGAEAKSQQNAFKKDALLLQTEKIYMQLQLAYKAVEVYEKAQKTAEANLKTVEDFYNQDLLVKSDVLSAKVRKNEVDNALNQANSMVQNLSDQLKYLMNDELEGDLLPENELDVKLTAVEENKAVDIKNRSDVVAMELQVDSHKKMNQAAKMEYFPSLNAFGNLQWFDEDILGMGSRNYFVGASLSWNLFEGGSRLARNQKAKAKFEQAKLEAEDYLAESVLELQKSQRALVDAENKMNRNKLSLDQAEEAFEIRKNRFEEGLERTADLLTAESQLAEQELNYYQSVFEFNFTQLYVEFLSNQK
ncbi:MAG: TolC family protein [Bacteroidota bacterium]